MRWPDLWSAISRNGTIRCSRQSKYLCADKITHLSFSSTLIYNRITGAAIHISQLELYSDTVLVSRWVSCIGINKIGGRSLWPTSHHPLCPQGICCSALHWNLVLFSDTQVTLLCSNHLMSNVVLYLFSLFKILTLTSPFNLRVRPTLQNVNKSVMWLATKFHQIDQKQMKTSMTESGRISQYGLTKMNTNGQQVPMQRLSI